MIENRKWTFSQDQNFMIYKYMNMVLAIQLVTTRFKGKGYEGFFIMLPVILHSDSKAQIHIKLVAFLNL